MTWSDPPATLRAHPAAATSPAVVAPKICGRPAGPDSSGYGCRNDQHDDCSGHVGATAGAPACECECPTSTGLRAEREERDA